MNAAFSLEIPGDDAPGSGVRLDALLAELGPGTVDVLGPSDGARRVRGAEFYDAVETIADGGGALLLIPSSNDIPEERMREIAEAAAAAAYSALVVKCRDGASPGYAEIAERAGIPVLRVDSQANWRLFDALLGRMLGEHHRGGEVYRDRGTESLFGIANELAGSFGGSVAIEDLGRHIVAYSAVPGQLIDEARAESILRRRVLDSPVNADQYRTVLRSETPVKFPRTGEEAARIACSVRAGALPLGTIWAIDPSGDAPLTVLQSERMLAAAEIASVHMLDDIRVRAAAQAPREERVRILLDGNAVRGFELAELGISEDRGATLLAFAPAVEDGHPAIAAQLHAMVQRHLGAHRKEMAAVARGGRVYAIVEHDPLRSETELVAQLIPVSSRLLGVAVRVAVPGIAHRAAEVAQLRDLADRMFVAAARGPLTLHERPLTPEAVRPLLVLERAAAMFAEHPALRHPGIEEMREQDSSVAETLLAWCGETGNVARTARRLGVHENTVRYRVRRAESHYGVDVHDADALLTAWLELRAASGDHPAG